MGLFSGPRTAPAPETRSVAVGLTQEQLYAMMGDGGTFASINANSETSRQSIAVDTAIDLICSLASELPLHTYRGFGADRVQISTPGNLADPFSTGHGLEDGVYAAISSWLYRGNLYGQEVEFDSRGRVRAIDLYHPDDVDARMVDGRVEWTVNGVPVSTSTFYHNRVYPVPGRVLGASIIERHQTAIATSLAAGRYGNQWFTQGAHPSGMLVNTEVAIDQTQAKTAKARWREQFTGTREPVVMGKGWDWKQLQVTAEESQFLATQRWTEAQCARMFGPGVAETLGYETGGSMTYANVAERRADLLALTVGRWLRRMERILTMLLPEPQYARFDRDALLESTTLARYQAHELALRNKWKTPNEVRDDEDMAPVAWGDEPITAGAAEPTPLADRATEPPITVNVAAPDFSVDARTMPGAVQVQPKIDARTTIAEGAVRTEIAEGAIVANVDATTALMEDSIRSDVHLTIPQPTPPTTVRKQVETNEAGRITAIIEERA